jgi:hypothetical protein
MINTIILFFSKLIILFFVSYLVNEKVTQDKQNKIFSEIPQLFICNDGNKVKSIYGWENKRRPELLSLFEEHMYGKTPDNIDSVTFKIVSQKSILDGMATLKQIELIIFVGVKNLTLNLMQYTPKHKKFSCPCFVGLNFWGNQSTTFDTTVRITDKWVLDYGMKGIVRHFATDSSRGINIHRWPVDLIIENGYGLITCHSADIDTDREYWADGAHNLFYQSDQVKPAEDEWGTIGAWAWGMSRIVDYIEMVGEFDENLIIGVGHSRLGKAALWAGAQDKRFAAVISNNSGRGGAALSRNKKGETVKMINTTFPHWFCDNFLRYNNNEDALPVDQHELIALIAPRPVYVASATKDDNADTEGEFMSTKMASPIYKLYGLDTLPSFNQPIPNSPAIGCISYHIREGKHDITYYDWAQFIKWANKYVLKINE